jgi:L-alanine-DL-glutamate epimerase-like enolase superfamily enzyme
VDRGPGPRGQRERARRGAAGDEHPGRRRRDADRAARLSGAAAHGGAQVVIFDPGWVGGITAARKVAALAEAYERPVAPHDCTGPVVYTAATHLSLHLPNAMLQESVRAFYAGWYREFLTALPAVENGWVTAPPGPGLGVDLRPEVFERPDVHIRTTSEEARR